LIDPNGQIEQRYDKVHLVPFGEYVPWHFFRSLVPALDRELPTNAIAGKKLVVFDVGGVRVGTLICFESIFPDLSREDVRRGARWLVNITNDEWFGNSSALYQHAAMAVFRACENHVPLARCANTGLTELIDANGRVRRALPVWRPGVLVGRLGVPGLPTFYTRLGDWPGTLAYLGIGVLLVIALTRRHASLDPPAAVR
jgi:apolipoprotein N-acyltransferase